MIKICTISERNHKTNSGKFLWSPLYSSHTALVPNWRQLNKYCWRYNGRCWIFVVDKNQRMKEYPSRLLTNNFAKVQRFRHTRRQAFCQNAGLLWTVWWSAVWWSVVENPTAATPDLGEDFWAATAGYCYSRVYSAHKKEYRVYPLRHTKKQLPPNFRKEKM